MSRLKLTKKLKPAKKAWKNFSNTVQSKLHKLNISKTFKTTLQLILSAFHTLSHLIIPSKIHRSLTAKNRSYSTSSYYSYVQRKNFAAIHINDLYSQPSSSSVTMNTTTNNKSSSSSSNSSTRNHAQGETSRRGKEVHDDDNMDLHGDDINTIEDAWKAVVAKSPLLQVDQKAEEFIYKFREDMRLQKEKSLLEFQERLARST